MGILLWIIIITSIAGVVGTGIGGALGALLQRDSSKIVSLLLAFAGGVMLAVVCFDLIPAALVSEETNEPGNPILIVVSLCIGYGVIYLLNYVIDKKTNPEIMHIDNAHPQTADALDELIHADHYNMHKDEGLSNRMDLLVAGIVMACAIALHNFPEGMVIGASYVGQAVGAVGNGAIIIAVVIGLHNIPEGMSVAVPLIAGGMKKWRAIVATALSGIPTVLGAIVGYLVGSLDHVWLSISLSFASGAMLYVVLGELLPESFLMWRSKAPGVATMIGIIVGLLLIFI